MKKEIVVLIALIALLMAGCQKQEEPVKAASPGKSEMLPVAPHAGQMPPFSAAPGSDPHAGLKSQEIPPGTARKGKVVQTLETSSHTYLEVEEKGQKFWIAALKTEVKKGDVVEFADAPLMLNFTSKALNRTFDKIIFVSGLRIEK